MINSLIKNWVELAQVPDSETHRIEIDDGCRGWIVNKANGRPEEYLSTHTFYKKSGLGGSDIFKRYGFDIEIVPEDY